MHSFLLLCFVLLFRKSVDFSMIIKGQQAVHMVLWERRVENWMQPSGRGTELVQMLKRLERDSKE